VGTPSPSLFCFPASVLALLERRSGSNCGSIGSQRCDLIAYAMELTYDLLIGLSDCISAAPGFETFLGYVGN